MKHLRYNSDILQICLLEIFKRLNLITKFSINTAKLGSFISACASHYRRVPYHSFTHGFAIVHQCYIILISTKARELLTDVDVLAIIAGALGHDLCHPGINNAYFAKTQHVTALAAHDEAILETLHCYNFLHILSQPQNNFVSHLPAE